MSISGKRDIVEELSQEDISRYNELIGFTPFSFFRDFVHPVIIFDYYENFALELIDDICASIGQRFETKFEYLVNPEINAGCMYSEDKNKIVVFEGTVLSLYAFSSILSCNYQTISMKKDFPQNRVIHTININTQYPDHPSITTQLNISSIPDENIVAEYIAMLAIKFIIAHEIGHILGGHLIYRSRHGEKNASFYMANNNSDTVKTMDLQTMEIDADSFAVCQLMSLLETELLHDEILVNAVSDTSEIYKLLGCAIQCVFYLIGVNKNQWIINDPACGSHPPALTRINLVLDICRGTISGENAEQKFAYIVQGVIMAHKNLSNYFNREFSTPEQFVLDIIGTNEYGMTLLDHWRSLKKEMSVLTKLPFI